MGCANKIAEARVAAMDSDTVARALCHLNGDPTGFHSNATKPRHRNPASQTDINLEQRRQLGGIFANMQAQQRLRSSDGPKTQLLLHGGGVGGGSRGDGGVRRIRVVILIGHGRSGTTLASRLLDTILPPRHYTFNEPFWALQVTR